MDELSEEYSAPAEHSVLPIDVDETIAARRYGISVIRSVFPSDRTVGGNLDEFELDRGSGRNGSIQEPIGIVRIEHWTNGGIEGRTPVPELHARPGQKDIVAGVRWSGVVNGEGDGNKLGGENRKLDGVRRDIAGSIELDIVDAVGN